MLDSNNIALLLDIAFAGCHKGEVEDARKIFDGVLAAKPGHAPAIIGKALSHIVVDDFATADELLDGVLATNPDDADAKAMKGLSLYCAGKKDEAKTVLLEAKEMGGKAGEMAESLLEQC